MYFALGVGLLAAAALLFAWAYAAHRRPVPARWTGREFLSSGICIVITAVLPVGCGYLAVAVLDPAGTVRSLEPISLGLMALSVAAAWALIPRLLRSVPAGASAPGAAPPRSPSTGRTPDRREVASSKRAPKRAA